MDFPIIRAERPERSDALDRLRWLLERARRAAVGRIVLPFVDASRIVNKKDAQIAEEVLRAALPAAEAANVELHLETDLGPQAFAGFLNSVEHGFIKVNYDSGNSASLGYDALKEFAAYGPRIGSVHIKDRRLGGGTVELGTGSANLPAVFQGLHKVGYAGDFVLQAARGEPGAEVVLAARHRRYVKTAIAAAAGEPQTSTH
jgi:hexulose-6-phosphate isomerase